MTEYSDSFNNNSIPLSINTIKKNLNDKFKNNMTEREETSIEKKKKQKDENYDKQLINRIKNNLNMKKIIERRSNTNAKDKRHSIGYTRINSHKILITNININLYKNLSNKDN